MTWGLEAAVFCHSNPADRPSDLQLKLFAFREHALQQMDSYPSTLILENDELSSGASEGRRLKTMEVFHGTKKSRWLESMGVFYSTIDHYRLKTLEYLVMPANVIGCVSTRLEGKYGWFGQ